MNATQLATEYANQRNEREKFVGTIVSRFSYATEEQLRSIEQRVIGLGFSSPGFSYDREMLGTVHIQDDPNFLTVLETMRVFVHDKMGEITRAGRQPGEVAHLYDDILRLRDSAEVVTSRRLENTFKYSFISLMATFDAAVFDLAELAICSNFAHASNIDKKRSKISFDDIRDSSDLNALRQLLAARVLKPCYIRELVRYLLGHFDLHESNSPSLLQEALSRRNALLHSASTADQKYLDESEGNPHGVALGDNLCISNQYLDDAEDHCEDFVQAMTLWIEGGAITRVT